MEGSSEAVVGAIGGGALATVIGLWARRRNTRAEADKTTAEAHNIEAEAAERASDATLKIVDAYRDMLEPVLSRVKHLEAENKQLRELCASLKETVERYGKKLELHNIMRS